MNAPPPESSGRPALVFPARRRWRGISLAYPAEGSDNDQALPGRIKSAIGARRAKAAVAPGPIIVALAEVTNQRTRSSVASKYAYLISNLGPAIDQNTGPSM